MPVRIYEIAKKLGLDSQVVLTKARALGITHAKAASSTLDKITGEWLENELAGLVAPVKTEGVVSPLPKLAVERISAKNFKAFSTEQHVRVKPITLIFGANSAGKSSAIHSLLLARHAIETGDLDASQTQIGGDAVDLGGFGQYVHGRNSKLKVQLEWQLGKEAFRNADILRTLGDTQSITARIVIGIREGTPDSANNPDLLIFGLSCGSGELLNLEKTEEGCFIAQGDRFELLGKLLAPSVKFDPNVLPPVSLPHEEGVSEMLKVAFRYAVFTTDKILPTELQIRGERHPATDQSELSTSPKFELGLDAQNRLLRPIGELVKAVSQAITEQLYRLMYLGPLRSFPARHLAFAKETDPSWRSGGGSTWEVLAEDSNVRGQVNDWLGHRHLSTNYRVEVLRYIAPEVEQPLISDEVAAMLKTLESGTAFETRPAEVGGGIRQIIKFQSFNVDEWATRITRRLRTNCSADHIDDVVLRDLRTNTLVTHRDVGIGVSQVLPVLVHAFGSQQKLLAIEQPEIHLHPSLQAELADVFIESALGERKNTFLLETHSEHLILRILRRVRETTAGTLPAGMPPVRPEDVSVVYVQPGPNGSEIIELPVTPDGDFGRPWPGGFFGERFQDLP